MSKEEFIFRWNECDQNFPQHFSKFLEKEEFFDMTLVAESHSFSVHRVILSAISPYFYEMFSKSKKTFVLLENINHRSLKYLIDFIYSGKVEVKRSDLKDFLRAAKILRVRGIDDVVEKSNLNNSLPMPLSPISNQPADNEEICDLDAICETNKSDDQINENSNVSHDVEKENSTDSNETENFDDTFEDVNWTPDSDESYASDEEEEDGGNEEKNEEVSYCTCECPCPDETNVDTEQNQSVCVNVTCPAGRSNVANEELNCPPSKRARADSGEFNIVADIRVSQLTNRENLFYNGYKFTKQQTTKSNIIYWQCSSKHHKCRAIVHTKKIDRVMKMKVCRAEHTHPPPKAEENISEYNIDADIRVSQFTNRENLFYNGYKFTKHQTTKSNIIYWLCTSKHHKCRAIVHTKKIDRVMKMKVCRAEHTHPPPKAEENISEYNIKANIRKNDRNFEKLHHDGYKFHKGGVYKSSTHWICIATKCNARVITRNVNGVIMAKLTSPEHNHERNTN